jgi:hypothetical protein
LRAHALPHSNARKACAIWRCKKTVIARGGDRVTAPAKIGPVRPLPRGANSIGRLRNPRDGDATKARAGSAGCIIERIDRTPPSRHFA